MAYFVGIFALCVMLVFMDTLKCNKNLKQLFYGIAVIGFIMLATIRTFDFQDTMAYVDFYNSQIGVSIFAPKNTQFEWGFVFLTRICTMISNNYRMLFFVQALIVNLIAISVLKKSECKLVLYACVMAYYGVYNTFITMRAGLAIAFFVLGVMRCDKKWIWRFLCFAVSFSFHVSASIMIILYLIAYLLRDIKMHPGYVGLILIFLLMMSAMGVVKNLLIVLLEFFEMMSSRNLLILKAIRYLSFAIDVYEFAFSYHWVLNLVVYLLALFVINKYAIKLSNTMRANLIFIFFGLCMEALLNGTLIIGRLTAFSNVLNIGAIGIVFKNNMTRQAVYQSDELHKSVNISKIRGLQWYNLCLAMVFVCMDVVFMFRVVYC